MQAWPSRRTASIDGLRSVLVGSMSRTWTRGDRRLRRDGRRCRATGRSQIREAIAQKNVANRLDYSSPQSLGLAEACRRSSLMNNRKSVRRSFVTND
jgi:hypothetical protein